MSDVTAPQRLLKQPAEVRKYAMDFSNVLSSSETIVSSGVYPQVASELLNGGSSDLTIYNEAIDGNKIEFWVSGGTDGTSYRLEVSITTSAEQILEGDGILRVTDR
jgi:hypothetical protein|tara:strand:- start:309 stop:626 length:318 start_codon:yes stop_codon:yes gene_type:complete